MPGQGCGHQGTVLVIVGPMIISNKTVCEKQHNFKRASPLFVQSVMQITEEKKKIQNRVIRRKLSQNSISPKQELSLSSKFLKESYDNLGWKEFRPSKWSSKSRASFQFNEVAQGCVQASFMYKDGNSATLPGKYSSVLHPHCAEIFSFYLWGRFNISVFKVKIANSGLFSMPDKDI